MSCGANLCRDVLGVLGVSTFWVNWPVDPAAAAGRAGQQACCLGSLITCHCVFCPGSNDMEVSMSVDQ
jgi:hypothetical protein